jgi:pyruvate,water dikinase
VRSWPCRPAQRPTCGRRWPGASPREAILARPGPLTYGAPEDGAADRRDLPPEAAFADDALRWLIERSGHWLLTHEQAAGDRITGVAGSAGRYTGPARILRGEADFGKLQPGDVLVCPITSPTWSVLFPQVGALVTDAGGLLSHSAIIAREFRLPGVVATGNATALLRDGQLVTVDGTDGSVSVVR